MKLSNLIKVFAFSLLLLGVPAIASAQWRNDDRDYRNSSYDRRALQSAIDRVRSRAREFERRLDRYDDRDRRYGNYGNNLDRLADQFNDAAGDLRNAFGRGRNLSNSYDEASRLIQIGHQIDYQIGGSRSNNRGVQSEWQSINYDLRTIANAYGIGYNNRGRGRGNGGGNSPWPF